MFDTGSLDGCPSRQLSPFSRYHVISHGSISQVWSISITPWPKSLIRSGKVPLVDQFRLQTSFADSFRAFLLLQVLLQQDLSMYLVMFIIIICTLFTDSFLSYFQQVFKIVSYVIVIVMWSSLGGKLGRFSIFSNSLVFWEKSIFRHFSLMLQDFFLKFCMWIAFILLICLAKVALKLFFTVFEISADEKFTSASIFQLAIFKDLTMPYDASWREDSKYVIGFDIRGHLDLENDLQRSKILNFQNHLFWLKNRSNRL